MEWPAFTVGEVVADPGRKMRLFDEMRKGLSVTSAYSGLRVSHVLREKYNLWPQIDFIHACDIARGSQAVLRQLARNLDLNASCVFGDLEDRLPLETKNVLASLAPSRTAPNSEKACAYKENVGASSQPSAGSVQPVCYICMCGAWHAVQSGWHPGFFGPWQPGHAGHVTGTVGTGAPTTFECPLCRNSLQRLELSRWQGTILTWEWANARGLAVRAESSGRTVFGRHFFPSSVS